jgi:hypothetical protein
MTTTKVASRFTEEEKIIFKRLRAHRAKREKEMRGMTNKEKADYMNRLGEEAAKKLGLTPKRPAKANKAPPNQTGTV